MDDPSHASHGWGTPAHTCLRFVAYVVVVFPNVPTPFITLVMIFVCHTLRVSQSECCFALLCFIFIIILCYIAPKEQISPLHVIHLGVYLDGVIDASL